MELLEDNLLGIEYTTKIDHSHMVSILVQAKVFSTGLYSNMDRLRQMDGDFRNIFEFI
jgi:hypothetical protein